MLKLNFGQDIEAQDWSRFSQDIEAEILLKIWSWIFVKAVRVKFGPDFEVGFLSWLEAEI